MRRIQEITYFVVVALTLWTGTAAIRIEILNAQAGYYLPRKDRLPDGSFADGKWRISRFNTPPDQLRRFVGSYGLMQYILAPALLGLGIFQAITQRGNKRLVALICACIGGVALALAFYRAYFSSLGS